MYNGWGYAQIRRTSIFGTRCIIMFNHQTKLQVERYLNKDYRALLIKKFEALPLKADAATLQNARHLTLAAREFFGGSNFMNEVRPSNDKDSKTINSALRACFLALKTWAKLLPALSGSPDEFEARLAMAELYSKCGKLFYYGFVHDSNWDADDYFLLPLAVKKPAFEWLARRLRCHECALRHALAAEGCAAKEGLQTLADQSLYDRISTAYENMANATRSMLLMGDGVIGADERVALLAAYDEYNSGKAIYAQKDKIFKAVPRDPAD